MNTHQLRALRWGVSHQPWLNISDGGDNPHGGGGGSDDPKPVDPAAHQRLADAHERLKRDAQADRETIKDLTARLEAIEAEKAKAEEEAAAKSGDVEQVKAQLEAKHTRELAKEKERADRAEARLEKVLINERLSAALDEVRVKPELKEAAAALLRSGVELREEGEDLVPYKGGLPLGESIKLWAADDKGKAFVLDGNSGGGASGGAQQHAGKNPWKQGQLNMTEQDQIQAKDPALASRLKAEAGVA
jgi:hypothetical protein